MVPILLQFQDEFFRDKESGGELEVTDKTTLLEWLANNYKKVQAPTGTSTMFSSLQDIFCPRFVEVRNEASHFKVGEIVSKAAPARAALPNHMASAPRSGLPTQR